MKLTLVFWVQVGSEVEGLLAPSCEAVVRSLTPLGFGAMFLLADAILQTVSMPLLLDQEVDLVDSHISRLFV